MQPYELSSRLRVLESGLRGQALTDVQPWLEAPRAVAQRLQALKEDLAKSTHLTPAGQQATWRVAVTRERQAVAGWYQNLTQQRAALERTKAERLRPPAKATDPVAFLEQQAIRDRLRTMSASERHLAYLRAVQTGQQAVVAAVVHDPVAALEGSIIDEKTQAAADALRLGADIDAEDERLLHISYIERDLTKLFDAADPPTPNNA